MTPAPDKAMPDVRRQAFEKMVRFALMNCKTDEVKTYIEVADFIRPLLAEREGCKHSCQRSAWHERHNREMDGLSDLTAPSPVEVTPEQVGKILAETKKEWWREQWYRDFAEDLNKHGLTIIKRT
jgi:hypothetical protein